MRYGEEFRVLWQASSVDDDVFRHILTETQTSISISPPLPNCPTRVVSVSGDTRVSSTLAVCSPHLTETLHVSHAQKALVMVLERMAELEGSAELKKCSLLARPGQMASLIGKAGCVVKTIQKLTGANIRGFRDFLPHSALPGDEIIQITGQVFAVKKALIAVSRRLQPFPPWVNEKIKLDGKYKPSAPLSCGVSFEGATNGQYMPLDYDRDLNFDGKGVWKQVSFRLLCPYDTAGGVIGKNAEIIKAMEREAGASIRFSAPLDTSRERVATIVSIEKQDPSYSPAQVAVNLVFTRSMEVKGMDGTRSVEARILVGPEEIDCLIDDAGRISADIKLASGIEIQVLGAEFAPSCAKDNDIVVQLTGGFAQVKETLYQITGRLRERLFSKKVSDKEGWWQHHHSSTTMNNCNGRGTNVSSVLAKSSMRSSSGGQITHGLNQKFAVHSPRLPHEMFKTNAKADVETDHFSSEAKQTYGSIDTETTQSVTVEMAVPEQAFPKVYGENGINLARLKEISGASIIVQNPCPGKSGGKVVISGTMTQIQFAQSLLHAFILL